MHVLDGGMRGRQGGKNGECMFEKMLGKLIKTRYNHLCKKVMIRVLPIILKDVS